MKDRKTILLKAAYDLLKKAEGSHYTEDALGILVFYDGARCAGSCLMEDIEIELGIIKEGK